MSDRPTEQQPAEDQAPPPAAPYAAPPATPDPPTRRWSVPTSRAAVVGAAAAALVVGGVIGGAGGFGLGFLVGHHGLQHDRAPLVRLDPDGDRFGGWRDWRGPVPDRPRWAEPSEESESPSLSSAL